MIGSDCEDDRPHRAPLGGESSVDSVSEHLGVGEEERRIEAEEEQSRNLSPLGVTDRVVIALDLRDPSQHGGVWMPRPLEHREHGERDGKSDTGKDPEYEHPTSEATASAKSPRLTRKSHR